MSKAWSGGSTRAWRQLRCEVLDRDHHQCGLKHAHCEGSATEVHHLDGKANGDEADHSRYVAACRRCHATETRRQTIAATRQRPRSTRDPERHPGLI